MALQGRSFRGTGIMYAVLCVCSLENRLLHHKYVSIQKAVLFKDSHYTVDSSGSTVSK